MKLLTWNLCSKPKPKQLPRFETLKDVVTLLDMHAASDLVIGCVQEAPTGGAALRDYVKSKSQRLSCVPLKAKAHILYSRDIKLKFARRDRTERAIVARFETPSGSRLDVVGLHREDQESLKPAAARGGASALLRANLDELLDVAFPAIMLGDFNAEPNADEIVHERCFFARTDRHHLVARHETATGTFHRPFFVKESVNGGTYFYTREECWKTIDFLLVSRELRDRVTSVERLTTIAGKSLLRTGSKDVPNPKISDHLPVLAELLFQ